MPKNTPSLSLWSQVIKYTSLLAGFSACVIMTLLGEFNIISIDTALSFPLTLTFGIFAGFFAASLVFCALKDLRSYFNKKPTLDDNWPTRINYLPTHQHQDSSSAYPHQTSQDTLCKVMILGDSEVGKSQLFLGFAENTFADAHISTIGVDLRSKDIKVDNSNIKLQLWDIAGNPRYATIVKSYYKRSHGFLLVFDITNRASFEAIETWHKEITKRAPNANIILVGNKSDLEDNRQVTQEDAKHYANQLDIPYIETSAKTNTNVAECFQQLVDAIAQRLGILSNPDASYRKSKT